MPLLASSSRALRPSAVLPCLRVITMRTSSSGRSAREELAKSGIDLMKIEIGYRVAFAESLGAGQGVTAYAPRDAAAAETRALVSELLLWEKKHRASEAGAQPDQVGRRR